MLDKDSSLRLRVLRFPLSVGTVFAHSYGTAVNLAQGTIGLGQATFFTAFVVNFVSHGLARLAVPIFFVISGYLFFSAWTWSGKNYLLKLKKRARSLLIPFLFWNLMVLLFIAAAQNVPGLQDYFSGKNAPVNSYTAFDYLNAFLGLDDGYPIAYPLWFVRDLIVLVLLTPLIYLIHKTIPTFFLGVVFICWLLGVWPVEIPSDRAISFFYLGTYLAAQKQNLFGLDKHGKLIVIGYLLLTILDALSKQQWYSSYLNKTAIFVGVAAVLYLTKYVITNEKLTSLLVRLSGATFFVFAAHEPLLTILRKVAYKMLVPVSSASVLALYFSVPILTVLILLTGYYALRRVAPGFTNLITGGREERRPPALAPLSRSANDDIPEANRDEETEDAGQKELLLAKTPAR